MKVFLCFILLNVLCVNGAKLLVFSVSFSKSHMISNGRIADSLAQAGHDVTLLNIETLIPMNAFQTTKYAKIVTIGTISNETMEFGKNFKKSMAASLYIEPGLFHSYTSFSGVITAIKHMMKSAFMEGKETIEKLKAEKFDAIFVEQLFPQGNALGYLLGIDVHFMISSCPMQEHITSLFGIPNPTGWVPSIGKLAISDKMSFLERAQNELENYLLDASYTRFYDAATEVFQNLYGTSFPGVKEIIKNGTPLIFVAVDEFIDFPRPILHNIIYVGGLGMKTSQNETLEEPFASEMKKGEKGVVFFSLGSNVDSSNLPEIVKKNLIDAFASFPEYHFIIKLEAADDYGINYAKTKPNIFVTNWAPQSVLLQQPRLKLFFTHGGYNSLLEVAQAGKPVLLMPMMLDQIRNGQIAERNGWGKVLNKMELLKGNDELIKLLNEMLNSEKYQKEAYRIKHLLETKPFSANEIFTKNVEFVLKNGGKLPELKPASMDMNFITQNNIDVYVAAAGILFLLLGTVLSFVKFFTDFFLSPKKMKKN